MPQQTKRPGDQYSDEALDPFQQEADEIFSRPDMQAFDDQLDAMARDHENGSPASLGDREQQATEKPSTSLDNGVAAAEQEAGKTGSAQNSDIPYTKTNTRTSKPSSSNRKKIAAVLGIGGIGGILLAGFMSILPLKLNALITNATQAAERIPGYAVKHRSEYLMTRVMAARILQVAHNLDDKDIEPTFCRERGAVGCSLLATYTAERISDKLGMDMIKVPGGSVRISINPKGRTTLGGSAQSWEIVNADWKNSDAEYGISNVLKKIETHKDMRNYLSVAVEKGYKNTISRYVARRILMLKYGVRSWRAFEAQREKIDNKLADVKTRFKVGMYKNTIAKLSPRYAAYTACLLSSETTCETLFKDLNASLDPPGDEPRAGESQEAYERRKRNYEAMQKLGAKISGEIPETPTDDMLKSSMSKIFSKKMLAIVGGVASVITITDSILSMVYNINNGKLDEVGFDMAAQAYTGLAFGDETGVVPNWEKLKVGDLDGMTGAEVASELGTLVDCDGSTLCAHENGFAESSMASVLTSTTAGAAATGYSRECSTSEGLKQVVLEPGELVCPERKLYRNYAKLFVSNPAFQTLAQVANVWHSSIGGILAIINKAVGDVVSAATGWITQPIMDLVGAWAAPLINWLMDTIFNPPSVGYETTPANNYDALSGALHLEQWELMKNGIVDGVVQGGGGTFLTEKESQAIIAYEQSEEQDSSSSQSTFAKVFDTSIKGSLAQQLVLQTPNSMSGFAKFPAKALATILRLPTASAATAPVTSSPFGLPNYSYKLNDPVLNANPNNYTEAYCTESAAAREASLDKRDGATIPVYTKTDPCALEKLVVGALVTSADPTDPHAFPSIGGTQSSTPSVTDDGTCAPNTKFIGKYDKAHDNGKQITITLCELSSIKLQPGFYTDQDPALFSSGSGGLIVGASVSDQFQKLGEDALPNRQLMGKGIRSYEKQEYFYNCYITKGCNNGNLAAKPGTSNHENGTAVDFVLGAGDLAWLRANGSKYGLKELKGSRPEPWHWSP